MATKTFNSIDRSVDYVAYTPTANCDMAYNSGMNTSAQNEIALYLNVDLGAYTNLDVVNYLQEVQQWMQQRQAHAQQNYCFWGLLDTQCTGGTAPCGQGSQAQCTGWTGLQCSCHNQGYLCNKTSETLGNYRNGWNQIVAVFNTGLENLATIMANVQAELETDVNNADLYNDLEQSIQETNQIVANTNLVIARTEQVDFFTKVQRYIIPALIVLVITGVGAYFLKKYK